MDYTAGYCTVEVADSQLGLMFPVEVFYPARVPEKEHALGLYHLHVALDAPLGDSVFALVLVSHGTGGAPLTHRLLAQHLARHGFVVGLPEHPFNNRDNNAWQGTGRNLMARLHHLRLAIDTLFGHAKLAAHLKPATVAIIGHSLGGYSALALAGGEATTLPHEAPDGQSQQIPTVADGRVKALVLLAPATLWFGAGGALRSVRVPILLLTAEKDAHTSPEHAEIVLAGISSPGQVVHRVVANAGHFSFLSPFPAARVSASFPPSQDPPGFDRPRFHQEMNAEVLAFLIQHT